MPLYEFQCKKCNHYFEEIASVGQTSICPKCSSHDVQNILSAPYLKSGSMPFKPGPVHPIAKNQLGSSCPSGNCGIGKRGVS